MSNQPPLRKPRHADGRLMTEDEIRGLDGRELDLQVHHCLIDSDPIWLAPQNRSRVRKYSTDIADAFQVDRPEWRWQLTEYPDRAIITVQTGLATGWKNPLDSVSVIVDLRKLSAADHARARCIAALLLAAKIGE